MNALSSFASLLWLGASLLATLSGPPLHAATDETSAPAPLAARALLLAVARAGDALVAVGDHGNLLVSRDEGVTWQQRPTPTRALLTGVNFPDARHGWAVGHDGVILATTDGGETWRRQDAGQPSDTVLLDVLFLDAQRGFVLGAYGKFLATADGGATWTTLRPDPEEVHYNHLTVTRSGHLYLTGESGTFLISTDTGQTWRRSDVPYDGSLFGSLELSAGSVLTYGLRGHILRSPDAGESWLPEHSAIKALIMAGIKTRSGTIVLAGQGGNFFLSHDAGQTFLPWKPADFGTSVADLIETEDGQILTVGEAGAIKLKLP